MPSHHPGRGVRQESQHPGKLLHVPRGMCEELAQLWEHRQESCRATRRKVQSSRLRHFRCLPWARGQTAASAASGAPRCPAATCCPPERSRRSSNTLSSPEPSVAAVALPGHKGFMPNPTPSFWFLLGQNYTCNVPKCLKPALFMGWSLRNLARTGSFGVYVVAWHLSPCSGTSALGVCFQGACRELRVLHKESGHLFK